MDTAVTVYEFTVSFRLVLHCVCVCMWAGSLIAAADQLTLFSSSVFTLSLSERCGCSRVCSCLFPVPLCSRLSPSPVFIVVPALQFPRHPLPGCRFLLRLCFLSSSSSSSPSIHRRGSGCSQHPCATKCLHWTITHHHSTCI